MAKKQDGTPEEQELSAGGVLGGAEYITSHVATIGDQNPTMNRRTAIKMGLLGLLGAGMAACTKTPNNPPGNNGNNNNNNNTNTDVSSITVGRVMPFYAKAAALSTAQSTVAKQYERVFVQPGFTNLTYGMGPFGSNAVGYMSGISLVSKSLSTSASTFVPSGSVLDLEGRVNAIPNGWLKHNGNKVATTFSAGNTDPAYMADIRIEAVQDAFVEYGVKIGHTYGQGAVVDEADQALYFSESNATGATFPGLSEAFEEQFRRIAWANYYNYPLDQEFQKDANGEYKRDGNGNRISNIEQVVSGNQYVAKNKTTGEIYSPLGHSTEPLSGMQPTGNGNVLTDKMLKYTAYSSCKMTLESRVYHKAGDPTDAAYRNEVTNAMLVYARYAKAAGRTIIHISDLEPAKANTDAGYKEAAIETAKYWDSVIKRIENEVGIKVNVNMSIQSTGPGGYFTNDNPQDFIKNKDLVNVLKDAPELNGIKVIAHADMPKSSHMDWALEKADFGVA